MDAQRMNIEKLSPSRPQLQPLVDGLLFGISVLSPRVLPALYSNHEFLYETWS